MPLTLPHELCATSLHSLELIVYTAVSLMTSLLNKLFSCSVRGSTCTIYLSCSGR